MGITFSIIILTFEQLYKANALDRFEDCRHGRKPRRFNQRDNQGINGIAVSIGTDERLTKLYLKRLIGIRNPYNGGNFRVK